MDDSKKFFRDAARVALRQNVVYQAEISELHKCLAELTDQLNEFDRDRFLETLKDRLARAREDALVNFRSEGTAAWLDDDGAA